MMPLKCFFDDVTRGGVYWFRSLLSLLLRSIPFLTTTVHILATPLTFRRLSVELVNTACISVYLWVFPKALFLPFIWFLLSVKALTCSASAGKMGSGALAVCVIWVWVSPQVCAQCLRTALLVEIQCCVTPSWSALMFTFYNTVKVRRLRWLWPNFLASGEKGCCTLHNSQCASAIMPTLLWTAGGDRCGFWWLWVITKTQTWQPLYVSHSQWYRYDQLMWVFWQETVIDSFHRKSPVKLC